MRIASSDGVGYVSWRHPLEVSQAMQISFLLFYRLANKARLRSTISTTVMRFLGTLSDNPGFSCTFLFEIHNSVLQNESIPAPRSVVVMLLSNWSGEIPTSLVLPMPSWPLALAPQHSTSPSIVTAQVKLLPAARTLVKRPVYVRACKQPVTFVQTYFQ